MWIHLHFNILIYRWRLYISQLSMRYEDVLWCANIIRCQLGNLWLWRAIHLCPPSVFLSQNHCSALCPSWEYQERLLVVYLWFSYHERFPEDELTCSEFRVLYIMPSESLHLCLILSDSLGRLSYKSKFSTWSFQETLSAILIIRV